MRGWITLFAVVCLGVGTVQACSGGGSSSSSSGTGSGSAQGGGGSSGVLTGQGGSTSVQQGAGGGTGGGCAETSSQAESGVLPADIIVVVDNSGSMDLEEDWVQQNMNAMVTAITSTGIDAHVIMIDSRPFVPIPLGSGSCPNDENLPNYRHVFESIGSNNGLEKILQTYPQWQASLRANATKTIVIVTDDDSDLGAGAFTAAHRLIPRSRVSSSMRSSPSKIPFCRA